MYEINQEWTLNHPGSQFFTLETLPHTRILKIVSVKTVDEMIAKSRFKFAAKVIQPMYEVRDVQINDDGKTVLDEIRTMKEYEIDAILDDPNYTVQ